MEVELTVAGECSGDKIRAGLADAGDVGGLDERKRLASGRPNAGHALKRFIDQKRHGAAVIFDTKDAQEGPLIGGGGFQVFNGVGVETSGTKFKISNVNFAASGRVHFADKITTTSRVSAFASVAASEHITGAMLSELTLADERGAFVIGWKLEF